MDWGQKVGYLWRFAPQSWVDSRYVGAALAFSDHVESEGQFLPTDRAMRVLNTAIAWEAEMLRRGMQTANLRTNGVRTLDKADLEAVLGKRLETGQDPINQHKSYLEYMDDLHD